MTGPAAVILAGGQGERLGGVIKAGIRVGGTPLLHRVGAMLAGQCRPIFVSVGRLSADRLPLLEAHVPIADPEGPPAGPLAGLVAAVELLLTQSAPLQALISVAVDTPFLPSDYVARLLGALGDHDAALASYAGQAYPTNGAWRLAALRELPERYRSGRPPHSLRDLAASLDSTPVEWSPADVGNPFANVNTMAELLEANRRIAGR